MQPKFSLNPVEDRIGTLATMKHLRINDCVLMNLFVLNTKDSSTSVVQWNKSSDSEQSIVWVDQNLGVSTSHPQVLGGVLVFSLQVDNSLWVWSHSDVSIVC